jgi:hypothetical protein
VAAAAGRRWGVIDEAGLDEAGVGRMATRRAVASARMQRAHSGVYYIGVGPMPPEARRLAAVLAVGDGAHLGYRSAAAHWGLRTSEPARPEVIAPRRGRRQIPGVHVHESRRLDADQFTTHRVIPISTVARTLADLAAVVSERETARAVERAEVLQLLDVKPLLAASEGRPGHAAVRRVLGDWAPAPTHEGLETELLDLIRSAGFPEPVVNVPLLGFEVDLLWREAGLVVEADSMEFHGSRPGMERDRRRDALLAAHGFRVLRFTWRQVTRRPLEVERALRAALG